MVETAGNRPIPFYKMHGSGNDFVLIDQRERVIPPTDEAAVVRAICQRRVGIGADGVIFIEPVDAALPDSDLADFRWRYRNADGSNGEMCGNGAMCGARFAMILGIAPANCTFQTDAGLVRAEVDLDGPRVSLAMVDSGAYIAPRAIGTGLGALEMATIPVGVPHAVIVVDDADRWPGDGKTFHEVGREIRRHPVFSPAGTNVNCISLLGDNAVRMRTYERGVEAETLACGTGAVACAIVASRLGMVDAARAIRVMSSGGWPLEVAFAWDDETSRARAITLAGAAIVVARGELLPDAWGTAG